MQINMEDIFPTIIDKNLTSFALLAHSNQTECYGATEIDIERYVNIFLSLEYYYTLEM